MAPQPASRRPKPAEDWIGIRLDVGEVDWAEVAEIVEESYRMTAPKRLVAALDAQRGSR